MSAAPAAAMVRQLDVLAVNQQRVPPAAHLAGRQRAMKKPAHLAMRGLSLESRVAGLSAALAAIVYQPKPKPRPALLSSSVNEPPRVKVARSLSWRW